jgi:hypothetical protein
MADPRTGAGTKARRDDAYWASTVPTLSVGEVPAGAIDMNVTGRRMVGPLQGFGQLRQKTYRIRLGGVTLAPAQIVGEWKANYGRFWPKGSRFFGAVGGIAPGQVALINAASLGGVQVATGIRVIYADDESFTFMNAAGHPAAGMITFSAEDRDGSVQAQVQVLIRANDPFYDLMLPLYGHRAEDALWSATLRALAAHFGASGDEVVVERVLVDRRRNWSEARNIWQNAAIRSGIYMTAAPLRWIRRLFGRDRREDEVTGEPSFR